MTEEEIVKLLEKYTAGNCTPEERALAESLYLMMEDVSPAPSHENIEAAYRHVKQNLPPAEKRSIPQRWMVAASLLLLFSAGLFLYPYLFRQQRDNKILIAQSNHLAPGKRQATLTLANGERISLEDISKGKITAQGNAIITKTADGQVIYKELYTNNSAPVYNTITTPRGGEYALTLTDGTRVWLNAVSSIVYPAVFTGKTRDVKITGEVYFEVARHPEQPFRVSADHQTVNVLGTHFNVNSYTDEPTLKTTLFEGKVNITGSNESIMLSPGEQAVYNRRSGKINLNKDLNLQQVLAWKDGRFYFDYTDAETVLRQIARWYDVDIQFNGKIPQQRLSGSFSKYTDASKAIEILEYAGVNLKIEGRKIIVE